MEMTRATSFPDFPYHSVESRGVTEKTILGSLAARFLFIGTSVAFAIMPQASSVTSSEMTYYLLPKPAGIENSLFLTSQEAALKVVGFFGLSKSDLSKVFGVSRPALYAWLDGTSEPQDDNRKRLEELAKMAAKISVRSGRGLFHVYVTTPISNHGDSLLTMLMENADSALIESVSKEAYDMTLERDSRLAKFSSVRVPVSELESEQTLNSNIADIAERE